MIKTFVINSAGAADGRYITPLTDDVRRLTVTKPIDEPIMGRALTPFPGVLESAWFDDVDAAMRAFGARDLGALVAPGAEQRYVAKENLVFGQPGQVFPPTGVKLISLLKRSPGMSVEAFQHYWREKHAPLVRRTPKLKRYVQTHLLLDHYAGGAAPPCDGTAELWWDNIEDYRVSWASREMQEEQNNDARTFLGPGLHICITKETVIRSTRNV